MVAAARVGGAGAIVTDNVRDFPNRCLPAEIRVVKPQEFAADTVAVSPGRARRALETMINRRAHPPLTTAEVWTILADRYGMVEAVELLRHV